MMISNKTAFVTAVELGLAVELRHPDLGAVGLLGSGSMVDPRPDLATTYVDGFRVEVTALTPDGEAFLELVG